MSDPIRQWHRLFGIALTDLFSDTPWLVELEKELAVKRQLLDVVIIARTGDGMAPAAADLALPDGFEDLRRHTLLTFKSRHEALDGWALDELIGHYVSYRKLVSPNDRLLPEADFGLYAVSVRRPEALTHQDQLRPTRWRGVFDIPWRTRHMRLVVLNEIAQHPRNAALELFSTQIDRIRRAVDTHRFRSQDTKALLYMLLFGDLLELPDMAYTIHDFRREVRQKILQDMTPEERHEMLKRLTPEDRLRGLDPEDRLRGLSAEELQKLKAQLAKLN